LAIHLFLRGERVFAREFGCGFAAIGGTLVKRTSPTPKIPSTSGGKFVSSHLRGRGGAAPAPFGRRASGRNNGLASDGQGRSLLRGTPEKDSPAGEGLKPVSLPRVQEPAGQPLGRASGSRPSGNPRPTGDAWNVGRRQASNLGLRTPGPLVRPGGPISPPFRSFPGALGRGFGREGAPFSACFHRFPRFSPLRGLPPEAPGLAAGSGRPFPRLSAPFPSGAGKGPLALHGCPVKGTG
jgi:hypothetical protein